VSFGSSIYLFGGYENDSMSKELLVLEGGLGESASWRKVRGCVGNGPSERTGMQGVALEGELLFFGGCSKYLREYHNETYLFDPIETRWTLVPCEASPSPRIDFSMSSLSKQRCLIFGGLETFLSYSDTHLFDLGTFI
jgi:hypothetical protein